MLTFDYILLSGSRLSRSLSCSHGLSRPGLDRLDIIQLMCAEVVGDGFLAFIDLLCMLLCCAFHLCNNIRVRPNGRRYDGSGLINHTCNT
jgi:hypothetical protein